MKAIGAVIPAMRLRLINTDVLKSISLESGGYQTETELLIKASLKGFKIGSADIETIHGIQIS
jgi:hypothetical protein